MYWIFKLKKKIKIEKKRIIFFKYNLYISWNCEYHNNVRL